MRMIWNDSHNDIYFWRKNFLNTDGTINYQKAKTHFNCSQRILSRFFKKNNFNFLSPNHKSFYNLSDYKDKAFWEANFILKDGTFNYKAAMSYFNCNQATIHKQIKRLKITYTKRGGTSLKEIEIFNILQNLGYKCILNSRKIIPKLELDIYLPDLKLGIEVNDNYWHSWHPTIGHIQKQKDLNFQMFRHQEKSKICYYQNIRLLHIYDSDDNVEQKLKNFLDNNFINLNSFELDSGCYPLGLKNLEWLKPESKPVLKNRLIWDAGKIYIKEGVKND
jgi:hypothetical protein